MTTKKTKTWSSMQTGERLKAGPHRLIVIPLAQDPRNPYGSRDVYVGVNGYSYSIRRGKPVAVPEPVVTILRECKRTTYVMQEHDDGMMRSTPIEVQDYPFQDMGPCTREGVLLSEMDTPKRPRRKKADPPADEAPALPEMMTP